MQWLSTSSNLIYFSSSSQNTHRFVEKVDERASRIPLHPKKDGMVMAEAPFVLMVPSYGGGNLELAIPRQVKQFLNVPENRGLLRGVITSGNTNFGEHYCIAGTLIAKKCRIPELYRFELIGTTRDVACVRQGLERFRKRLVSLDRLENHVSQ